MIAEEDEDRTNTEWYKNLLTQLRNSQASLHQRPQLDAWVAKNEKDWPKPEDPREDWKTWELQEYKKEFCAKHPGFRFKDEDKNSNISDWTDLFDWESEEV